MAAIPIVLAFPEEIFLATSSPLSFIFLPVEVIFVILLEVSGTFFTGVVESVVIFAETSAGLSTGGFIVSGFGGPTSITGLVPPESTTDLDAASAPFGVGLVLISSVGVPMFKPDPLTLFSAVFVTG